MIIEITEDKVNALSENIEKALHYAGKAMQCAEAMRGDYREREHYQERYGAPHHMMGWRDDERMSERHYDHRYDGMGERRHRDAYGRYM